MSVARLEPAAVLAAALDLLDRAVEGVPGVVAMTFATPTLVIGSAQSLDTVDATACTAAGVGILRRGSGGGAVLCDPGLLEVDVALPRGHPLLLDDVTASYRFLGEAWLAALDGVGVAGRLVTVDEARSLAPERLAAARVACYAGLSPYEVVDAQGLKLVGLCQRRRRGAALFQCSIACGAAPSAAAAFVHVGPEYLATTAAVTSSPHAIWRSLEPLLAV